MKALESVTVQAIVELESPFMNIRELLPDLTSEVLEANRDWMPKRLLGDGDMANLVFQSFIVKTPRQTILIDSCIGNDKHNRRDLFNMRRNDTYMRALKQAGLTPDDIDVVMCTHLHADHVGWNTRLDGNRWVPTFPKARYVFGREEFDHWTALQGGKPETVYTESVLPVVEAGLAQIVDYNFELEEAMRLLPTPGHTPGHFAVAFGTRRDELVITGDLLHTSIQLRHPELSVAFDTDKLLAAQSRRGLLEAYCDQPTLCCFGHFPMALNGRITRWETGFRCEPMA
ncbi:MBL fold metallo-hydrolase [Humitalea sp. 24SJ18S-53]|uniref:MBL fold metallo-hydrolase n=1 Tax=Humitalea sp. 24SJ18S-53 TaxID=3422307 RepID=UPI003D67884B